jgi:hypothetical protein
MATLRFQLGLIDEAEGHRRGNDVDVPSVVLRFSHELTDTRSRSGSTYDDVQDRIG